MFKRFSLIVSGLLVLGGVALPSSAVAAGDGYGSTTLHKASDLPPSTGIGRLAAHGYLPLHARAYAAAKAAANRRAGVGGATGPSGSASASVTTSSFPNVSPSFQGTYQTGLTPPDTTGAKGPDRYIEGVNTAFAVYDSNGKQLGSGTLSALTGISTGLFGYALSDPQFMWDPTTQRFYFTLVYFDSLTLSDNGLAIGWSKTATPTSASDFCSYTLGTGSILPDYPKIGDTSDELLFGYNKFTNVGQTYGGSAFAMLNKPAPGSTCQSAADFSVYYSGTLYNRDGTEAATPVPANLVDSSQTAGYVVANADLTSVSSADFISVYKVTDSGTTDSKGNPIPTVSGPVSVPVAAYSMPANAPQKGSPYLLDTLDGRFEAAVAAVDPNYGTLAIWTAHAVNGNKDGNAGVEERWYEIDPAAGSLLQHGTVGSTSLSVWNGSISPDRADNGSTASHGGDMAMSVSTSSPNDYPAIQFVTKSGGDATSPLQNLVQSGGADVDLSCSSSTPCRWGDYSGASPDPAAVSDSSGRIWLDNQYNLAGGKTNSTAWRTWVFQVTSAASSTPSGALSVSGGGQSLVAGTSSSVMSVSVSPSQSSSVGVTLSSSSAGGGFSTSGTAGSFSPTLQVTVSPSGSVSFYYEDTVAGTPTISAVTTATGISDTTALMTVTPDLSSLVIAVTPSTATVASGSTQQFTASGVDQYTNPVDMSGATWSSPDLTDYQLSTTTGASTVFTAGTTAETGHLEVGLDGASTSATVTVTVPSISPPTNLTATARGKHIALSWSASSGAVTYDVYRTSTNPSQSPPWTEIGSGSSSTSFNDQSVASGVRYWYYVTAVDASGTVQSLPSNTASATAR